MVKREIYSDKRGWIRIVEAAVAILIIAGVVLILIGKTSIRSTDSSEDIYKTQNGILDIIRENNTLREEVLGSVTPINSTDIGFSTSIKNTVNQNTPAYLECVTQICLIDNECIYPIPSQKDVYSRSTIISANLTIHNPKQIKLFCYRK
jgi:hypothetical protein